MSENVKDISMKEEKDFNAGFFIVSVRSGYAAPITSGGASRRGTAVTFGWRKSSKLLSAKRLKASPISTELIVDSRRAVHRICGFTPAFSNSCMQS